MRRASIGTAVITFLWAWLTVSVETSIVFRFPQPASSVNPLLVATLSSALFVAPEYGVGFAFICGLMSDIALGNAVGLRSIPLVLCAAVVGMAQDKLSREHPVTWMLLGVMGSLLHDLVYFSILGLVGYLPMLYDQLIKTAAVSALANGILSFVCLLPAYLWWRTRTRSFPDRLD